MHLDHTLINEDALRPVADIDLGGDVTLIETPIDHEPVRKAAASGEKEILNKSSEGACQPTRMSANHFRPSLFFLLASLFEHKNSHMVKGKKGSRRCHSQTPPASHSRSPLSH